MCCFMLHSVAVEAPSNKNIFVFRFTRHLEWFCTIADNCKTI